MLVVVLLLVATAGGVVLTRGVVRGGTRRVLRERTGEVAVVLNTSIGQLSVGLETLGQVARVTDAAAGPFTTTARAVSSGPAGVSYALLRPAGGGFRVVLAYGGRFRPGEVVTGARVPSLDAALASGQPVPTPVLDVGAERRFGVALGPPAAPAGMVVYRESQLGSLQPPKDTPTAPFHELDVVLYAGDRADPSQALVSTAPHLPLHGTLQARYLNIGAARLLLTVAPATRLNGALNADAPWLVGAFGVLMAALIGFIIEQATRRRDSALALYRTQRAVAETLQRSLLPELRPIPGLSIATRYLPGAAEQRIGGDWFDCFPVGDVDDRVAIVIGDVMGHDMQAAAAMAQIRAALRAYSCETDDPASVLGRLQHLVDVLEVAPLVTIFYGVLDPPDGSGRRCLRYSNAGHLPPLLRGPDGSVDRVADATSTIIGAPHVGGRPVGRLVLTPGATLVLFTDGLVETVGGDVSIAIDSLAAALSAQPPTACAEELSALLEARSAGPLRDDVATLVLQVVVGHGRVESSRMTGSARVTGSASMSVPSGRPGATSAPPVVDRLDLACDHTAAGVARSWVADRMEGWPSEVVDSARLIVSELVTNAVLHAKTAIAVTAETGPDRIVVEVIDGSSDVPVMKRYGATAETGRGFRLVSTLADEWGVEQVAGGGKAVRFALERRRAGADEVAPAEKFRVAGLPAVPDLSSWPDLEDSAPADGGSSGSTFDVWVLALPVEVYLLAAEHNDALLREMTFLPAAPRGGDHPDAASYDEEALAQAIRDQFAPVTSSLRHQIDAALAEGRETVDLRLEVPRAHWDSLVELADRLDEADRLCEDGELLTLEAPALIRRFRRWFADQVSEQAAGRPATPWPGRP